MNGLRMVRFLLVIAQFELFAAERIFSVTSNSSVPLLSVSSDLTSVSSDDALLKSPVDAATMSSVILMMNRTVLDVLASTGTLGSSIATTTVTTTVQRHLPEPNSSSRTSEIVRRPGFLLDSQNKGHESEKKPAEKSIKELNEQSNNADTNESADETGVSENGEKAEENFGELLTATVHVLGRLGKRVVDGSSSAIKNTKDLSDDEVEEETDIDQARDEYDYENSESSSPRNRGRKSSDGEQDNTTKVFEIYKDMFRLFKDTGDLATKEFLPLAMRFSSLVPPEIWPSMLMFVNSAFALHPWALRFIDACGKFPYGLVDGTVSEFGEFDQCLDIEVPGVQEPIVGKYCVVDIKLPLPPKPDIVRLDVPVFAWNGTALEGSVFDHLGRYFHTMYVDSPRLGICIPSHFEASQVAAIGNSVLGSLGITIQIPEHQCTTKNKPLVLTGLQKVALATVITITTVVALASAVDYLYEYKLKTTASSTLVKLLLSFSIIRNTRRLVARPQTEGIGCQSITGAMNGSTVQLGCLHGIRVLTMFWIVINHTYLLGGFFLLWIYRRVTKVREWPTNYAFQLVYNGWLTVETFFFLSGLILVYCSLPMMTRANGRFNYPAFLLHRIFRILPALFGAICLNVLMPLLISGPVALVKAGQFISEPCEKFWWSSLLFINNWFDMTDVCLYQSWYLSADTQLYVIAPLILLVLYKSPRKGLLLCALLLVVAMVSSGAAIYYNELPPAVLMDRIEFSELTRYFRWAYFPTFQHLAPYCIGMLFGYALIKKATIRIGPLVQVAAWILLPGAALFVLLITAHWNRSIGNHPSLLASSAYVALRGPVWSLALGWMVFALATDRARFINKVLSWRGFVPISRLSFGLFLTHTTVLNYKYFSLKQTQMWNNFDFLYNGTANFFLSLLASYALYVTFEAPFVAIEKLLFARTLERLKSGSAPPRGKRTLSTIDLPSGPRIAYNNSKLMELVGPMISGRRLTRVEGGRGGETTSYERDANSVVANLAQQRNDYEKNCRKDAQRKRTWDNSVHSKSFVYVERM